MFRKAILVGAILWASPVLADSRTTCHQTLMGGMDCTTTSSEHPYDAGQRSMQQGINSLANAIAARGARKREERERQAAANAASVADIPIVDLRTGNGFLAGCSPEPKSAINFGLCYGFLMGMTSREWLLEERAEVCVPEGVTRHQTLGVVTKFVVENPAYSHRPLPVLAHYALKQAFPCTPPAP